MKTFSICKVWVFSVSILVSLSLNFKSLAQYTLQDGDVVVTNGVIQSCGINSFSNTSIIIPETLDGQTVTGISDAPPSSVYGVFYDKDITSVTLPSTIETIGTNAFRRNTITSVNFSSCTSLKSIAQWAFYDNNLSGVDLRNCSALISIVDVFGANYSLSGFYLPIVSGYEALKWRDNDGTIYNGGDYVSNPRGVYKVPIPYTLTDEDVVVTDGIITSCSYDFLLKDITIPNILDGQTITGIADGSSSSDGVFNGSGIFTLVIPPTIKTIGDYAFYGNNFDLDFSSFSSLQSIGVGAFYANRISNLNLSGNTFLGSIEKEAFNNNDITNVDLSNCTALTFIGESAFYRNELTSVNLTGCSGLLSIKENAFGYNTSLSGFILPTNTTYPTYGWKDSEGNSYTGGESVSELDYIAFRVPLPYTLNDDDVEVTSGIITSCSYDFFYTDIIIPETLDEQTIIGIENGTNSSTGIFAEKGITSLQLPSTLQTIGDFAFSDNYIRSLDLSGFNSLTYIGEEAFFDTPISDLNLNGCTALEKIGDYAFSYMELTSVDLTTCTALSRLGSYAFSNNQLSEIDLTKCTALIYIGEYAFAENTISSFTLPIVTGYTMYGWLDENNTIYNGEDVVYNLETYYKVPIPYTLTDDDVVVINGIIESCSYDFSQTDIIIPETLDGQTVIGIVNGYEYDNVFSDKGITSVQLPSTIEFIGYSAFYYNELTTIDFSNCTALDSIGEYAFESNNLDSLDLSNLASLRIIAYEAFAANNIQTLNLSGCSSLNLIGEYAFYDNAITDVNFTGCTALKYISDEAFYENDLTLVDMTPCTSLNYIGSDAFDYNSSLTGIILPTVTGYEQYEWRDDNFNIYAGGETVTDFDTYYEVPIPYTLTDNDVVVTDGVITSCSYSFGKKDIIIPDTLDGQFVKGILTSASSSTTTFRYRGIISVKLPSGIKNIGDYTFEGNEIYEIEFTGNQLETIGKYAFASSNIDSLDFSNCPMLTSIGDYAFDDGSAFDNNDIRYLNLKNCSHLESIGNYAFQYNSITELDLSSCSGLKTIGQYAFYNNTVSNLSLNGCTNLGSIGSRAFMYNNISSLDFSTCSSLTSIEAYAFYGNNLTGFNLPTPVIPGFIIETWKDGGGTLHPVGSTVSNLNTGYTANLTKATLVNFWVSDGQYPIEGASIRLSNIGITTTNEEGLAQFSTTTKDSLNYIASAPGYLTITDSISALDTFVEEYVMLSLCTDTVKLVESLCEGDSYTVGDSMYTETGIYRNIYTNQAGCDSVIELDLTVNPIYSLTIYDTLCAGGSSALGDTSYTETGIYFETFSSVAGCDSMVTLDLTVYSHDTVTLVKTICDNDSVVIGPSVFDQTGLYREKLINQHGCDSIINLDLTVNPSDSIHLNEMICDGETFQVGDSSYSHTGSYLNILTNQFGCDSVVKLDLTVNPVYNVTIYDTLCAGNSSALGDTSYIETGIYTHSFSTIYGCDSTVTLELMVYPYDSVTVNKTICEGDFYMIADSTKLYNPGIYWENLENRYGCDSVVDIHLSVIPKDIYLNELICEGNTIVVGDSVYTQTGSYSDTLTNRLGCDSIVNLDLTVIPKNTNLTSTICDYDSVIIGTSVYHQTGNYSDTLINRLGCDSIINLNLTVNRSDSIFLKEVICEGETVQVGQLVYSSTGNYINVLSNTFGCDSVVSLSLTINPVYEFIEDEEICEGDEYLFQGTYYNIQGTYTDTFSTQNGCDSIYKLNLTVLPSDRSLSYDTINYGETFTFRGEDYSESGLYSDTLVNRQGCDSIISVLLYVYRAPVVFIPDDLFKAELLADTLINTNKDDEIQVSEAAVYTGKIDVNGKNIKRFIGIEAFENIDTLVCSNNLADSLDLSLNTQLTYLDCSGNEISYLQIESLEGLLTLICADNDLTILEPGVNHKLERIDCSGNYIVNLDLSQNTNLLFFNCSNNQLQSLNLRNGNNENMTISAGGNSNLSCVTVDNIDFAIANWAGNFDSGIVFSTDCASPDIAVNDIQSTPGLVYPEDTLLVSWQVINYGNTDAIGGWNERISLVSGTNQKIYLNGNLVVSDTLLAGDTIRRNALLAIPAITKFSGPAKVMVELIPTGALQTQEKVTENNKLLSESSVIIKELFYFEISENNISENYPGNIRCNVTRSGNSDSTLLITLSTASTDINLPPTVGIMPGNNSASFYFSVNNNNNFDGLRVAEIVALAPGFDSAQASIEIEDDDVPEVWVTIGGDTLTEGQTVNAIIETNLITDTSQYFNLTTSKQSQWSFSTPAVIPVGDSTVEMQIDVTDDLNPELDNNAIIMVAAKGYNSNGDTAFILDNDIPGISIELVEDTISEAAGDNATWLTLTRDRDNNDVTISVLLSTNNTNDIEISELVHFFPGEMTKQIPIDMIDNDQVDGAREAVITAAVYIPSCYCNSTLAGTDTTMLVVSDNDGPSLTIVCNPQTLQEGIEAQGTLTIIRNTPTDMALLVSLTLNNPGELLMQDTVTIPVGSSSVDLPVTAINDGIEDSLQVVTVRASAAEFSSGTVNIYTSDQNKPDLIVSSLTTANSELPVGGMLEFQATIKNTGFLKAPAGISVDLYLSSDKKVSSGDILLESFTTEEAIPIGDSTQLWELVAIPETLGDYYLILKVNPNETITELLYTNNTSTAVPVSILSNYTATAIVNENAFTSAQPITIHGTATMNDATPATNKLVEVYVITQGIRRTVSATTDTSGEYSTTFAPGENELGHYTVGACHPDEDLSITQDEFDIMGFGRTSNEWLIWYVQKGETITGSFSIKNYSNAELNNLKIELSATPNGFSLDANTISTLEGNGTASFNFSVTGNEVTSVTDYIQIPVKITSDQGVSFQFTALYFCQAIEGLLKTEPVNLETSFTKGKTRYIEFLVYNIGAGNSGEVSISLPDVAWMSLASAATIENIEPGAYSKVTLRLQSVDNTPLNYPMTGQIAINATNSDGLVLPYRIECVSEETGNLLIDVVDEYTYNTEEGPHLADAHVKVSNPYTGEVVGEGYTSSDGQIEFTDIPEGTYVLLVEAEDHDGSRQTITINPGQTTQKLVFISFQAISYSWTVVPTEIEDEYEIVLNIEYETNVPKPVVTLEIPTEMPALQSGETFAFMATLTNHGLITAEELNLDFPSNDIEYEFVFQDKEYTLPAGETLQIPVVMQRKDELKSTRIPTLTAGTKNAISVKCHDVSGYEYGWRCGPDKKYEMYKTPYSYRRCDDDDDDDGGDGDNDGTFSSDTDINELLANVGRQTAVPTILGEMGMALPGLGGIVEVIAEGSGTSGYDPTSTDVACEPCLTEIAKFAVGKLIPGSSLLLNVSSCFDTYNKDDASEKEDFDCLLSMVPNAFKEELEKKLNLVGDINSLINIAITCYGDPPGMNTKSATEVKPDMPPLLKQAVQDLMYVELIMNAQTEWQDEFWGPVDWQSKENLSDLAKEIELFVNNHDKFSELNISDIKYALLSTDISPEEIDAFTSRWNITVDAWNNDVFEPNSLYPDILDGSIADNYIEKTTTVNQYIQSRGFLTVNELFDDAATVLNEQIEDHQNSVCASVTLSISQKLVMTREAFRGTLTIKNGHETMPIEEFQLNLEIKNENGELCNDLFEIETESLLQLTEIDGSGTLPAMETGTATILFIPEKGAAPTITKSYNFGGSITYLDPFTSTTVTKTLFPVTLEVHPSPDLFLHYFMERDILGDDPLTPTITEPVIPGELALMIENNGYGNANNVLIESAQPEIVDNEKGLLIEFELIGSNLQGLPVNLGLINIDFGTIFAQSAKVGRWWFTSSLLGHFVDYSASLTHTDSRGNPELSLVSGAEMHELIRSISVYGDLDDDINDFLVNDVQDVNELPDAIYLSQGQTVLDVYQANSGSFNQDVKAPIFTNTLTLSPKFMGWNYLKLDDPGNGMFEIESITRNNDGQQIPLDNAWLTFVTLPDGQEHVYENKFHIVDNFEAMTAQSYTVVWVPADTAEIKVVEISGAPVQPITEPLSELTIVFNKEIDASSFTFEDLSLELEGSSNIVDNSIIITRVDDVTYKLDISSLTTGDGTYELTVNTANINDNAGNTGKESETVTWTELLSVPAIEEFSGLPSGPTNQLINAIEVRFNMEIDATTFSGDDLTLYRNTGALAPSLTVSQVDGSFRSFLIEGISSAITEDGIYQLLVDLDGIRSLTGVYGQNQQYVEWNYDSSPPVLLLFSELAANKLDGQHVPGVQITFTEAVNGFTNSDFELRKDGILLTVSNANIVSVSKSTWNISGFDMLTYGEGIYTLKILTDQLTDMAGNSGLAINNTYSWQVDRTPPPPVTDIAVIPDLGLSNTDRITCGDTISVSMLVNEGQITLSLYETDGTTKNLLYQKEKTDDGIMIIPSVLSSQGNISAEIICTDSVGNQSITPFSLYLDNTDLQASISGAPTEIIEMQPDSLIVTFSEAINASDFNSATLSIQYNGTEIETDQITINPLDSKRFILKGFDKLPLREGIHILSVDLSLIRKLSSGKTGSTAATCSWTIQIPNSYPVADAGADGFVRQGDVYTLDGLTTYDPDGDPLTYKWYYPNSLFLSEENSLTPSFIVPYDKVGTSYILMLSASDGELTHTDKTVITIDKAIIEDTVTVTICGNESYQLGTQLLDEPGTYIDTLLTTLGADSIVHLNLFVNPADSVAVTYSICEGDFIEIGDSVYDETGIHVINLTNQFGCDSVITLDLTVNPTDSVALAYSVCEGEHVEIGDSVYSETGIFFTTLNNKYGCDSVVKLDLTVNEIDSVIISETICEGEAIIVAGTSYSETGIHATTLVNQYGFDSVIILDLTVNPTDSMAVNYSVCEGEQVQIGNYVYKETGIFVTTLSNQFGCDSVITLDLTVNKIDSVFISATVCKGDVATVGNASYSAAGIHETRLVNRFGCDSIVFLNLIINETDSVYVDETICEGEVIIIGDTTYSESGTYETMLTNQFGCDSVVILNLIVHPLDTSYTDATICYGETYLFFGNEYAQSGNYSETLSTINGCDSTVILNLKVLQEVSSTLDATICKGESFELGDSTYAEKGTYTNIFTAQNGCDSIVILNLDVLLTLEFTIDADICEGESYAFNDSTYATSGTYTTEVVNPSGCDSTFILNLTVHSADQVFVTDTIANGTYYIVGNNHYNTSGTYVDTLPSIFGCDSIINLNLTVVDNEAPAVLTHIEDINIEVGKSIGLSFDLANIIFNDPDDALLNYSVSISPEPGTWMETVITNGILTMELLPEIQDTGCYTVQMKATDPLQQSATDSFKICVTDIYSATDDIVEEKTLFNMYPNPTSGELNIELKYMVGPNIEILIYDNMGSNIFRKTYLNQNSKITMDVSKFVSGIYLITVRNGKKLYTRKLIIKQNK